MDPHLGQDWHARSLALLESLGRAPEVGTAADLCYAGLKSGGVVHAFGSGHSVGGALELFHRAGGLVPVNGILEEFLSPFTAPGISGALERTSGIGARLVEQYDVRAGEALLVFSVSGINPVPIEVALSARERGARVIAVSSRAATARSRHASGKRLGEVADLLLDNGVPPGDAAVEFMPGRACAALSGLANAYLAGRLVAEIVARYRKESAEPPVYLSANLPGGDEHNRALESRYRERIKGLWR